MPLMLMINIGVIIPRWPVMLSENGLTYGQYYFV